MTVHKLEDLITEELRLERRKAMEAARAEYRRSSLDYLVARQQHEMLVAGLGDGEQAPAAPVAPTAPVDPPETPRFEFPEVVKGFLYLRHVGISLGTRASLLRSSGGSLRYGKVSELLRRTEIDALVAAKNAQQTDHSYWAGGAEEDYDYEEEDDWQSEETYEDEDFAGIAEGGESEDLDPDEAEDIVEEPEGDYDTARIGYLGGPEEVHGAPQGERIPGPGYRGRESQGRQALSPGPSTT